GSTQTLTTYPIDIKLNYSYNIKSFAQYNGNHYLGGYWYDNNFSYRYFGQKSPGSSSMFYNVLPTADVNALKVKDGSLYLSGNFNSLSGVGGQVSPLVYINANTQYFGNATFSTYNVKKIAYINSTWILATNYANGYLLFSSGGNWYSSFGGGFDNQVNDLDVFDNTLYAAGNMQSVYTTGTPLNYVNYFDNNSNSWKPLGSNNLPGPCLDLEYYNNTLYATGYGGSTYIYYLDKSTNTWKSFLSSSVKADYAPTKICFVNGKLLVVENGTLYLYE
ncbi:MAG: hypothetical protein IT236_11995, partial [Bacteroidia bacterium]|nr:hypothetical protein [Bacteroidia bacterium]